MIIPISSYIAGRRLFCFLWIFEKRLVFKNAIHLKNTLFVASQTIRKFNSDSVSSRTGAWECPLCTCKSWPYFKRVSEEKNWINCKKDCLSKTVKFNAIPSKQVFYTNFIVPNVTYKNAVIVNKKIECVLKCISLKGQRVT